MSRKRKRIVATVLASVLTLGMLGGCGSNQKQQDVAKKAEENGEKIVIEYWHINSETVGGKTVDELVKEFNESNDHIEVVARYNPDEYKGLMQNLQAETAAGNAPAVVQIGWTYLNYFQIIFPILRHKMLSKNIFQRMKAF